MRLGFAYNFCSTVLFSFFATEGTEDHRAKESFFRSVKDIGYVEFLRND